MIDNNFRDTTFAPEDPQLNPQNQSNAKTMLISSGFVAALYICVLASLLIPGNFNPNNALRGTVMFVTFFLNFLLSLFNLYLPLLYWRALQQKRQIAFVQPESYLVSRQPAPFPELPQPDRVVTTTKSGAQLMLILLASFIVAAVVPALFFNLSLLVALLIGTTATLLVAISLLIAAYSLRNKPKWPYIEVSEDNIAAAIDKIRQPVPWQDICFFATYKGPSTPLLLSSSKHDRYYELASPQRIIRWRYLPKRSPQTKIQPEMDQQNYDRWHQQLLSYIRERTGLPLVDLDSVPVPTRKR